MKWGKRERKLGRVTSGKEKQMEWAGHFIKLGLILVLFGLELVHLETLGLFSIDRVNSVKQIWKNYKNTLFIFS